MRGSLISFKQEPRVANWVVVFDVAPARSAGQPPKHRMDALGDKEVFGRIFCRDNVQITSITGTPMMDTSALEQTYELADILIKKATKDQLAECARLLALNLAHHQINHGEIAVEETLSLLRVSEPNEEHLNVLMEGMLNLIGVLVNVCGGPGQVKH